MLTNSFDLNYSFFMIIDDSSFNMIIDTLQVGLYITNINREITHWNKFAELISGFKLENVIGTKCYDNVLEHIDLNGNSLCMGNCPLAATIIDKKSRSADVYIHHKNGYMIPVNIKTSPLLNTEGDVIGGIEIFSALTSTDQYNKESIDTLSGLYNKDYITNTIRSYFHSGINPKNKFGILRLDILNFTSLTNNKSDLNDKMIKLFSKNILTIARSIDIYGRWGHDEFIGLIPGVTNDELCNIAKSIKITTEKSFITYNGKKVRIKLSIAGTLCKKNDFILTLMERVDKLLFRSKQTGGDLNVIE